MFARWVGYFNVWMALLFLPGGLITFFKNGPFAYDGLFAFWIPVTIFCIWYLVMPWAIRQAVLHEPDDTPTKPVATQPA